jgi:hypothetical protein
VFFSETKNMLFGASTNAQYLFQSKLNNNNKSYNNSNKNNNNSSNNNKKRPQYYKNIGSNFNRSSIEHTHKQKQQQQ